MEDPILKTTEAELKPAHPSNLFDDMSLGDIRGYERYDFCRFDPTAANGEGGDGLDVKMFQAGSRCLNASVSDFPVSNSPLTSKDTEKRGIGTLRST
jgi:hypothetical protein